MTDRDTANAMPVVAHMYGVIVSKNLELYKVMNNGLKMIFFFLIIPSDINTLSLPGENVVYSCLE